MKSIVYHKVKKFDKRYRYDKFLHIDNFKKQIKYFQNKFNIVNCKKIFEKKQFKKNDLFLTFDDGLKVHYDYVYPQLKSNKINGIFYLSTLPFTKQKILSVHKIHILIAKIKCDLLLGYIEKNLSKSIIDKKKIKFFEKKIYVKQKNFDKNVKIKKILNYSIKSEYSDDFIGRMFTFFFPTLSEKNFIKEYYMSEKDLKVMLKNNMILGSHTQNHNVLSFLTFDKAKNEIDASLEYLDQFTEYRTFCYPYGSKNSYNNNAPITLVSVSNHYLWWHDIANNNTFCS